MKKIKLLSLFGLLLFNSCGLSDIEKNEIAVITCNLIGESKKIDGAFRLKELNSAREKLGEKLFTENDDLITEAFSFGLCKELVLNDSNFNEKITDARIKKQKMIDSIEAVIAEKERIEFEKRKLENEKYEKALKDIENKKLEKERIAKQKYNNAQDQWRKSILELLGDYKPNKIEDIKVIYNRGLVLKFDCEKLKGLSRKFIVKLKDNKGELTAEDITGYCGSIDKEITFSKNDFTNDQYTYLRSSVDKTSLIESITLEIFGSYNTKFKYKASYHPPLEDWEKLNNPIVYKLEF